MSQPGFVDTQVVLDFQDQPLDLLAKLVLVIIGKPDTVQKVPKVPSITICRASVASRHASLTCLYASASSCSAI